MTDAERRKIYADRKECSQKRECASCDETIFVLTGAGTSAESGIPVFQGKKWHGRSHYEMANIRLWNDNPQMAWRYYSSLRATARNAKPNLAHVALAEFENRAAFSRFFLCTQNIDCLHEVAGSRNIAHIHGKLFESRCAQDCGQAVFEDFLSYSPNRLPRCSCGALVRPNVCWFGEKLFELNRIFYELKQCSVFVAIGTSGSVRPAATFVELIKQRREPATAIYIGLDKPANAHWFDHVHLGAASTLVSRVLNQLCSTGH